jgi:hypothetical protein
MIIFNILIFSCRLPSSPEGIEIVKHIGPLNTYGECLDLDANDSIIVAAVNFNGFMIFDIYDSLGYFNPNQKYHGYNLDPSVGNDQISKIRISNSPPVIAMMDKYDKIFITRLDGSPIYYLGSDYLTNEPECVGAVWSDFTIDPQDSYLRMFNLVDNNMATAYNVMPYSQSIISLDLEVFSHFPESINSNPNVCEYSSNQSDEAETIHFSNDGLLTLGVGELGVKVYKQLTRQKCYKEIASESIDNSFYVDISSTGVISGWPWNDRSIKANVDIDSARVLMILEMDSEPEKLINLEFYSPEDSLISIDYVNESSLNGDNQLWIKKIEDLFYVYFRTQVDIARFQFTIPDISNISYPSKKYQEIETFSDSDDKERCEKGVLLNGLNGIYEPKGGLELNPLIEFDVLGEVNSVYSQNHLILTGLSNSNGLLLTQIDSNGTIIYQKSLAKGYSVNDVYATDTLIGLAVGHDGVLIYSIEGDLKGRLATNYANSVKIKDRNVYIGTEDGIEIFVIN